MIKEDKLLNNSESKTDTNPNLSKMYKDLSKAINSNNIQSIWELSKNITRVHFKHIEI